MSCSNIQMICRVCYFQLTLVVHNSLIRALGRSGLTREALRALDELVTTWQLHRTLKRSVRRKLCLGVLLPDEYTLSAVMETCKLDRGTGSATALLLWHRMLQVCCHQFAAFPYCKSRRIMIDLYHVSVGCLSKFGC